MSQYKNTPVHHHHFITTSIKIHESSILIMSSTISLHKLVKVLASKKTSPKVFGSLLKQLLSTTEVSDNEMVESLIEIPKGSDPVQQKYLVEYAVEFACGSISDLQRFMSLLVRASVESQRTYIVFLKNSYSRVFRLNALKEFIQSGYIPYTVTFMSNLAEVVELDSIQKSTFTHILFLWGDIIDSHSEMIPSGPFKEMAISVMSILVKFGYDSLSGYFTKKANVLMTSADLNKELQPGVPLVPLGAENSEKLTMSMVQKSFSVNWHSKKAATYSIIKKFMWLNTQFEQWQIHNLVDDYLQFFSISTHKLSELVDEIVSAFFGGITIAILLKEMPYVIFNWRNFIVSTLPIFLKNSRHVHSAISSENLGELLCDAVVKRKDTAITQMAVGDKPYDLRKHFLRNCIYQKIITLEEFTKLFPEEADALSLSLIIHETEQLSHLDSLTSELNNKLLEVNTEFTSLEESRLIEYFQSLPKTNILFLEKKQKQLNKLAHKAVDALVKDKSSEKLGRLLIAMANTPTVSNIIFFQDPLGPWGLLNKLILYLDQESFRVDEDDSNFQDTYAYFGVILSGIIAIVVHFNIDFRLAEVKDSYTINFITRFFYRHCEDLTAKVVGSDEDDSTIVANYNTLLQDWINALFDVNNEGLSDDLIKSINVKQTYKLITIIFQQAITANILGTLSTSGLNNGLDYLSQNFLAPCSLEIMEWILNGIGPLQPNSEAMVSIFLRIIEINLGNSGTTSDPNYTFRVLLCIVGPRALEKLQTLKNWRNIEAAARSVSILKRELGHDQLTPQNANIQQVGSFDLVQTIKQCLINYVREPGNHSVLSTWANIRWWWSKMSGPQTFDAFLQELYQCLKLHNHVDVEESKIFLDFLVFLVVATSGVKEEPSSTGTGNEMDMGHRESTTVSDKFSLTIDNHYSSIFNEVAGFVPESEKPPKDNLMGDFEMDDLFNDAGDDLFGDNGLHASAPFTKKQHSLPAIDTVYKTLKGADGKYTCIEQMLIGRGGGGKNRITGIAKLKLAQELEHAHRR